MGAIIPRRVIALDCDGVLLDYHAAYARAWGRAFGAVPRVVNPRAYSVLDRYDVRFLEKDELAFFMSHLNDDFWSSMEPVPGAVEACSMLRDAGYSLVCVSAISPRKAPARRLNLVRVGIPDMDVIAAPAPSGDFHVSPKASAIAELSPIAFVDDFLPYFRGVPDSLHKALIPREPDGSPNVGPELDAVHSTHESLISFARWWLSRS